MDSATLLPCPRGGSAPRRRSTRRLDLRSIAPKSADAVYGARDQAEDDEQSALTVQILALGQSRTAGADEQRWTVGIRQSARTSLPEMAAAAVCAPGLPLAVGLFPSTFPLLALRGLPPISPPAPQAVGEPQRELPPFGVPIGTDNPRGSVSTRLTR